MASDQNILAIKTLLAEKLNVPVNQQRLLLKGKPLLGNSFKEVVFRTGYPNTYSARNTDTSRYSDIGTGMKSHFLTCDIFK